jgi:hypothetical protein
LPETYSNSITNVESTLCFGLIAVVPAAFTLLLSETTLPVATTAPVASTNSNFNVEVTTGSLFEAFPFNTTVILKSDVAANAGDLILTFESA